MLVEDERAGPPRPSKIVAVHLNYRSRAAERGRTPTVPSYFLKPPSSLSGDGAPVVRPPGCELLAYEGEIAVVIGARTRNVPVEEARACIGWYAAANDFGVYDLRWADRGSNVLAKGADGFTPVGPCYVPASELDPSELWIETRVNGAVVQHGEVGELIFPFERLVADLSRLMTLEPGDVILTGTPANSRTVAPGDVVEVEVGGVGTLRNAIVAGDGELAPIGALPRAGRAERIALYGHDPRPRLPPETVAALRRVATATLSQQLLRRGIRNAFLTGLRPTRPDLRLFGYAHTLRYVPLREDVVAADTAELNAQKAAVEAIGHDEVLVIEARGEPGAGTIGDILALRALRRGATGIVTDGGLRDTPAVSALELPVYCKSAHGAVLGTKHFPLAFGVPVACAGVLVMPGDVLVGDAEGVIVVPLALAEEVARDAVEQELREQFAFERVEAGERIHDLFPLAASRRAEYEAWRAEQRTESQEDLTP